jgi:hypothetical protein
MTIMIRDVELMFWMVLNFMRIYRILYFLDCPARILMRIT